jgi:ribonuclease VapC
VIVVDTSALIAILKNEPEADDCMFALVDADRVLIAAPTLTEALIVSLLRGFGGHVEQLLAQVKLEVVPWDEKWALRAAEGYSRYGRNRHQAGLNFGDSFSYALAKEMDCPLLFVGHDFPQTDITAAI